MSRKFMSATFMIAMFTFFAVALQAQEDKSNRPSPPATADGMIGEAKVSIDYSQPGVKERKIWGGLVPYDKVWRTGANEATVFETSADLNIAGKTLPAGKYALFTIPNEKEWTIIFNSDWEQWGAFNYDKAKDVLRVPAKPSMTDEFTERMTFKVADDGVHLMWEKVAVLIPVKPRA